MKSARYLQRAGLLIALALVGILALGSGLLAAPTGVNGTVTVIGGKSNAHAVVYIDAIPGESFPAPAEPVVMDQLDLEFVPYVLPVQVGTTVQFHNSDSVLHNVFTPAKLADRFDLGTFPQGEVRSHVFDKPGAAVLLCNVHPEMEAWVVVLPTPYFAMTDETGSYSLEGVPPGEHTLNVWHPALKEPQSRPVVVDASGGLVEADFEVSTR